MTLGVNGIKDVRMLPGCESGKQRTKARFVAFDNFKMPTYSPCYLRRAWPCKDLDAIRGISANHQ